MNTELIEQNVHRLLGAMTGAATTAMVAVGDQLGLYRALADGGPATQDELAARTGTAARYLRGWPTGSPPAAGSPTSAADTAWPPSCWPAPTRRRASTATTSTTAPSRSPGSRPARPASTAASGSRCSTRPATRPTAST